MMSRLLSRRSLSSALATLAALGAVALLQTAAQAHYIWASVEKGQVRFALLEDVNEAPDAKFDKYVLGLAPHCGATRLTVSAPKDGASYATLPPGESVVLVDSIVRAKEREGGPGGSAPYLLIYHAKGAASLAAAGTDAKAPVELLARRDGKELVVSVLLADQPAPADCAVTVLWPGSVSPTLLTTDAKGEARVVWPTLTRGGLFGIRAMVPEAKSGEQAGKKYDSIHHWATLTFPVEAPKAKTVAATTDKPFTQILRASYGHSHEIVGDTAFNQTLFAGKLTKAQLVVHLQQRALIHAEVNRILTAADPALHVPYGAAQENVLVLLRHDLSAIGSVWPTGAQARPRTQTFLQEIRESEKQGPYFALGVQHIYYGGITNGGRMIGTKIGETLRFTPDYYEKSDGYEEYLPEVNKITDPAARQAMIRGGQAAYAYIIAFNNEDVFRAQH